MDYTLVYDMKNHGYRWFRWFDGYKSKILYENQEKAYLDYRFLKDDLYKWIKTI